VKFLRRVAFAFSFAVAPPLSSHTARTLQKSQQSLLFSENLDKCKKLDLSSSGLTPRGARGIRRRATETVFCVSDATPGGEPEASRFRPPTWNINCLCFVSLGMKGTEGAR
jgi:hypothetical protein